MNRKNLSSFPLSFRYQSFLQSRAFSVYFDQRNVLFLFILIKETKAWDVRIIRLTENFKYWFSQTEKTKRTFERKMLQHPENFYTSNNEGFWDFLKHNKCNISRQTDKSETCHQFKA